jgi:hypothetical protein
MRTRLLPSTALAVVLAAAVLCAQNANTVCQCQIPNGPPNPNPYLVG